MRGKVVTNPSIASETPQPSRTPPGSHSVLNRLRIGQRPDVGTDARP